MIRNHLRKFTGLFALVLLAGCGEAVAPTPRTEVPAVAAQDPGQPSAGLIGDLIGGLPILGPLLSRDTVIVLQRDVPLAAPVTVTKIIGAEGGRLVVPGTGLTMDFPAGALVAPTPITVTALPGRGVAYEFGPHGITFAKPVTIRQDLEPTVLNRWTAQWVRLKGGYFKSQTDLLSRLLRAVVSELLPATTDVSNMEVRFDIRHFSGYLVAVD
jgi:hypothetical protein